MSATRTESARERAQARHDERQAARRATIERRQARAFKNGDKR